MIEAMFFPRSVLAVTTEQDGRLGRQRRASRWRWRAGQRQAAPVPDHFGVSTLCLY